MSNNPFQPPSWWSHSAAAWNDIAEWLINDTSQWLSDSDSPNKNNLLQQLSDSRNWVKLTQGISNHCYRLSLSNSTTNKNYFFIKTLQPNQHFLTPLTTDLASQLFSLLQQQATLENAIIKNNLETQSVQVSDWFDGYSLTMKTNGEIKALPRPSNLTNRNSLLSVLCDTIATVHSVTIDSVDDFKRWTLPLPEYLERYCQQALARSPESSAEIDSTYKIAIKNASNFVPQCICHNDLNPTNIMTTSIDGFFNIGEIRIVDWEYASIGDPLFDLAGLIISNKLSTSEETLVIERYSKVMKISLSKNKLAEMKQLFKSISELWHFAV